MAHVVAVADIGKLEATQSAEALFEREEIRQSLARMKLVGKRVDHRNAGVRGHFLKHPLGVNARDDAVHPALQIARDIGNRFALAQGGGRLRVIEEHHGPAHALDADVECNPRAQGGLLKNQGDEFAVQC